MAKPTTPTPPAAPPSLERERADKAFLEQIAKRRKRAEGIKDGERALKNEIYEYLAPFRKSTAETGAGDKRVDRIFDSQPMTSAARFVGKLHEDLWQPGGNNYSLTAGPVMKARARRDEAIAKEVEAIEKVLGDVTEISAAAFLDGRWDQALSEACWDVLAGDGFILMTPDPDGYADFTAVSFDELSIEKGRHGGRFWTQKWELQRIKDTWPDGRYTSDFEKLFEKEPYKEVDLHQDCVFDQRDKRWRFFVWTKENGDTIIHEEKTRTCPWIRLSYFQIPGETWGRGVGHLAIPATKTLNTAAKVSLMGGAIAMLGIYTAIDDGVFNPDNARIEPGTFWKVMRNGGPLGPSVARFPDPRIDMHNLVLNELRMGVQLPLLDNGLPPDTAAVKSPTEILERIKRLATDHQGAFGRMVAGVYVQAVSRGIEIGWDKKYYPFAPDIDQLLVSIDISSPMALARAANRAQAITRYVEIATALLGPEQRDEAVKASAALRRVGELLGVDRDLIPTATEAKALSDRREQQKQLMMAAAAAGQGAAAGAADPFSAQNAAPPPEMMA